MRQATAAIPIALLLLACGEGGPGVDTPSVAARAEVRSEAREPEPQPREADLPITAENLLEREAGWPYQVELSEAWSPEGADITLEAGTPGVLIRVEEGGLARIDFAAGGVHTLPVARTNTVERANEVRTGSRHKPGPNFFAAIGPRIMDGAAPTPTYLPATTLMQAKGFLSVFADPEAEGFAELAAELAPLEDRYGVATVLFPLGGHPSMDVLTVLQRIDWPVPFMADFLAEPFSRAFSSPPYPRVMLTSPEGRLFFEQRWTDETPASLSAAIESTFAPTELASQGSRLSD